MSISNLEEQIGRIELAMDTYLEIYQIKDKLDKLSLEFKIDTLRKLNMWGAEPASFVPDYDPTDIKDSRVNKLVKEFIAFNISSVLFKKGKKLIRNNPEYDFLLKLAILEVNNTDLAVQIGLSVMDLYNKKIKNTETNFFEESKRYLSTNKKNKSNNPLKGVFKLRYKGRFEQYCDIPDYLKAKQYYNQALKLNHKITISSDNPEVLKECARQEERLKELIACNTSEYNDWSKRYHQIKKSFMTKFPIVKDFTSQHYQNLFTDLNDFKEKICLNYNTNQYENIDAYRPTIFAIKEHILKIIKTLKKRKRSPKLDKLLSNFYFLCSTIKKGTSYDTKVIPHYLKQSLFYDKTNLEAYHGLAIHYENRNNETEAFKNWHKLIRTYFEETNEIRLKKLENSTNEVGRLIHNKPELSYLFDKLIIKKSKKDFSKEYDLLKEIHKSQLKILIPKPIGYFSHMDSYNYLVTREAELTKLHQEKRINYRLTTLSDIIKCINNLKFNRITLKKIGLSKKEILDNFKIKYLKNSLKKLTDLQEIISSFDLKVEKYDSKDITKNKISKRLKGNKSLTEALEFLAERINNQEKCFTHGDYHSGNILIKQNKIIPIDFEYMGYIPLLYDPLFLLEDPNLKINYHTKEELIKYYLKEKNIEFNKSLKKDIDYMSLFVTLRWTGISSKWISLTDHKEYTRMKLVSLKKSEKIIDKMLTYTSDIEYSNLQRLKKCLRRLY